MNMKGKSFGVCLVAVFLVSMLLFSLVRVGFATTYYEWIQNGGFELSGGNLVGNPSFEDVNASFYPNNWVSMVHVGNTTSAVFYDGARSAHFDAAGVGLIYYFANNYSSDIISSVTAWWKGSGSNGYAMRLGYNDSSYTDASGAVTSSWVQHGLSATAGKFVEYVSVSEYAGSGSQDNYCDLVFVGVVGSGQTDFTPISLPWYAAENWPYQAVAVGPAHSGVCSAYTGYSSAALQIVQDIGFLDSNAVHNVSLYAKAAGNTAGDKVVRFLVVYGDRSYSYQDLSVNDTEGWKLLNFTGFILANKVIIQVQLSVRSGATNDYVSFDDVSLLASVPVGRALFTWSLSPVPVNCTNSTFYGYELTGYVMTCFVYNDTGYPVESGSYTVVSGSGIQSGNIAGGTFSFLIAARSSSGDFEENFVIYVVTSSHSFSVNIVAHWIYVAGGEENPPSEGGWYAIPNFASFIVLFVICGLPAFVLGMAGAKGGWGLQGLLLGLFLGVSAGVIVGLVPFWFIFVNVLFVVLFLFSMMRRS
jgi:hypothetical protein